MARPISWLPRLHEIRRSVAGSVRSHYTRQELERLFQLQPRAAQKLLELLPSVTIGSARLVEREALAGYLDRIHAADDAGAVVRQVREEKVGASRKAIRSLVQRDYEPVRISSMPEAMQLARGRLEVNFRTAAELAEAMYFIARMLEEDGDGFVEQYEPIVELSPEQREDALGVERMFRELES